MEQCFQLQQVLRAYNQLDNGNKAAIHLLLDILLCIPLYGPVLALYKFYTKSNIRSKFHKLLVINVFCELTHQTAYMWS